MLIRKMKIGKDTWKLQSKRSSFVIHKNGKYIISVSKNKVSALGRMGLRALLYKTGIIPLLFIDDILTFLGL